MSGTLIRDAAFLNRFQSVWSRKRQTLLWQVLVSSLLLSTVGFGVIAAADYVWELDRTARVVSLVLLAAGVLAFVANSLWRTLTHSGPPATAAEIEQAFPELGQSVRTTVQYGAMQSNLIQSEGVAKLLVVALAEQTHQRALPLTIEDVIPTKRLWAMTIVAAVGAVFIVGASSANWEWGNATQRAMLAEASYRNLEVRPGNQTIDEGTGTQIEIALIGRTNRNVVLMTRDGDNTDATWTERALEEQKSSDSILDCEHKNQTRPRAEFIAKFSRLTTPIEYRVIAGELASATYRIDIRRPLGIEEIKVELTPPPYTGQKKLTSLDGNLTVLEGTAAVFGIMFDKPIKSASIVLSTGKKQGDEEQKSVPIVEPLLERSGAAEELPKAHETKPAAKTSFSATLILNEDSNYWIVAEAVDGTTLPETKYRIRVREDQPPQVTFESPDDALEVHTLAELSMRVRVRDDYGLSKAGVVFQVNNEQSIPLIAQDFATVAAAANEVAATGQITPTTQSALEKVLPLEFFELTQKDSVMYFAFAEDNRPDNPQRTETDLRFIDIRPFKRTYQVFDPDPMPGMAGGDLKSLEELISRQRFGLNRTIQIEKRAAAGRNPDATTLDQLIKFETDLAANVRETAVGLQARGFDDVELFFQAETAMLAAVDSLSVAKWENATLQMKDALKLLIEQRDRTREAILKNPDPAQLATVRAFDRKQAQKLRRPKTDKEEARELIRRLEMLIADENAVVESLEVEPAENVDDSKTQ